MRVSKNWVKFNKMFTLSPWYEKQLKELQEAYGEAMLELRARKKLASLLGEDDR